MDKKIRKRLIKNTLINGPAMGPPNDTGTAPGDEVSTNELFEWSMSGEITLTSDFVLDLGNLTIGVTKNTTGNYATLWIEPSVGAGARVIQHFTGAMYSGGEVYAHDSITIPEGTRHVVRDNLGYTYGNLHRMYLFDQVTLDAYRVEVYATNGPTTSGVGGANRGVLFVRKMI